MNVTLKRKNKIKTKLWDYHCIRTKKHQIIDKLKNYLNPATINLFGLKLHLTIAYFFYSEA